MTKLRATLVAAGLLAAAGVGAEPMFLSKQYTNCTTCHYSPTGGGLLTPYGRSLSRQELSTWGRRTGDTSHPGREEQFLWGVLGDTKGLSLGLDMRPAHLDVKVADFDSTKRDFFMTADLLAAYRNGPWTVYGQIGRQPGGDEDKIDSFEYWVAHTSENGLGFRVGRFLPAYGVHLTDHTAMTRAQLGFDTYDQVYALEVSHASEKRLWQASVGPGRADSIIHDDGRQAFTASLRFQQSLSSRQVLAVSGIYRAKSDAEPSNGSAGLAYGISPRPWLTFWNEANAVFESGASGAPKYALLNETSVEVYRGLWLKVSPQLITAQGNTSGGVMRWLVEADLLPRTHWNIDIGWYRDHARQTEIVVHTWLAQLHLYL